MIMKLWKERKYFMKIKNKFNYILMFLFIIIIFLLVLNLKQQTKIELDYYKEQNLLVSGDIGFEVKTYHPTASPFSYTFRQKNCIVEYKSHE